MKRWRTNKVVHRSFVRPHRVTFGRLPFMPTVMSDVTAKLKELGKKKRPAFDDWLAVRALLDGLEDRAQEAAVAVFERAAAAWPTSLCPWSGMSLEPTDELRRSRSEWTDEILRGAHQPKHQTIRILEPTGRLRRGQRLENLIDPAAQLTHLKQVGLDQARISSGFLKLLKGDGPWKRWEVLRLWTCEMKPGPLSALAKAHLTGMKSLNLEQNRMGPPGMKALNKAPHFTALTGVALGLNGLGAEGLDYLSSAEWLAHLEHLELPYNHLDDQAFDSFFAPALEHLDVSGNPVGVAPDWISKIPVLRSLKLTRSALSDAGLARLLEAKDRPPLSALVLSKTGLTDQAALDLGASGLKLRELNLSETKLTHEGWSALLASPAVANLERLTIGQGFNKKNVAQLSDGACPKLRHVWCAGPGVDEATFEALRSDKRLKKLLPH